MITKADKNNESLNQYDNLLEEYTKLLDKNEKLESFTKKKIFDNASSLRNIKEEHTKEIIKYKTIVKDLQEDIKKHIDVTSKMNLELNKLKRYTLKVKKSNTELESKISILEEYQIPFEIVLETQLNKSDKENSTLIFAVIGIDNFLSIKNDISTFTTVDNFTLGIYKYIQKILTDEDTVYYFKNGTYFITISNKDIKSSKEILQNIGIKKMINKIPVTISSCIISKQEDDTPSSLLEKGLNAYDNLMLTHELSQVIEI